MLRRALLLAFLLGIVAGLAIYRDTPEVNAPRANVTTFSSEVSTRRLNYPYSLVPFGVQSAEELQSAMIKDAALAEHYRGFDFSNATFLVLDHDDCAYVSFRKAGNISWTQKCVKLNRGEKILTDAHYLVRAICGNQIAYRPQSPANPVDLNALGPNEASPTPAIPTAIPAKPLLAAAPAILSGGAFGPTPAPNIPESPMTPATPGSPIIPVVVPPYGGGSCCRPPTPSRHPPSGPPGPPVSVPESDEVGMLLLSAMVVAISLYAKHR